MGDEGKKVLSFGFWVKKEGKVCNPMNFLFQPLGHGPWTLDIFPNVKTQALASTFLITLCEMRAYFCVSTFDLLTDADLTCKLKRHKKNRTITQQEEANTERYLC
ncbi:TPA: hypothetical protein DD712_00305 [Candidatus Acetothermia bacterium]|nr:hypothetical protein [Candidatus Acetothermia bacterium]